MSHQYKHITIAGTFDHLHEGHKSLIDTAFKHGEKVSIGIAAESLWQSKLLSSQIESFALRKSEVEKYIKSRFDINRVRFFELQDVIGIALEDSTLDSIVVTSETRTSSLKINRLRREKGLKPLHIITIPFVKGNDKKIIRSSRIRVGDIDRQGNLYKQIFLDNKSLQLPEILRNKLRQPLSEVVEGNENQMNQVAAAVIKKIANPPLVIAVGDIVTLSLHNVGFIPDISIIDFKTKREWLSQDQIAAITSVGHHYYINHSGTISSRLIKNLYKKLHLSIDSKQKQQIIIKGEEDLIALPAILLAPIGSIVLYGQVNLGVVMVEVNEEIKAKVKDILKKFRYL